VAKIAQHLWSEEELVSHLVPNEYGQQYRNHLAGRTLFTDEKDLEKIKLVKEKHLESCVPKKSGILVT